MEQLGENEKMVLSLIGSRIKLLTALYPSEQYFITELSRVSGVDRSNISRYLPALKKYGIIDTKEEERESAGKPKKIIMLTETTRKLLRSYLEIIRKRVGLKPVNIKIVNMVTTSLENAQTELIQTDASEELVIISKRFLIPQDEDFLKFLEKKISDPKYSHTRFNLLQVLLNLVNSTKDEEQIRDLLLRYNRTLTELAEEMFARAMFKDDSDRVMRIYDLVLQILVNLSADESRFEYLIQELEKLLIKGLPITSKIRALILDHYPLKQDEIRWKLFKLYEAEPDAMIRKRYREQLLSLR